MIGTATAPALTTGDQDAVFARRARGPLVLPFAFALLALVAETAAILRLNGGRFTYTLDDPYIHLALSDHLRRLHHGINASEPSSPSSSILFPVLLAPAAPFSFHEYVPLGLNGLALLGSILLLVQVTRRAGLWETRNGAWFASGLVIVAVVQLNFIGLVFTGMEHSLHVMVTLAVVLGLIVFLEDGRLAWWLTVAIVAGPLLRYEGCAVSLGALVVLALRGRWRAATSLGLVCAALVGAYSALLVALHLPPLPTSVLLKSVVAARGADAGGLSALRALVSGLLRRSAGSGFLAVLGAAMLGKTLVARPWRLRDRDTLLIAFALIVIVAHLAAGRYGWFSRYEIYVLGGVVAVALYLWRGWLRSLVEVAPWPAALAAITLPTILVTAPHYVYTTLLTPVAANNIYEQQFQMHRFATEYHRAPVAINDLGLVSYRNPYYVLDLYGLGSEEARRARTRETLRPPAAVMAEMAARHDVGLAMIYDQWFKDATRDAIPKTWTRIATLHLSRPAISADHPEVIFYSTAPSRQAETIAQLRRFGATLPPRVRLEMLSADAAPPGSPVASPSR